MNRAFMNVLCADPEKSAQFYEDILGLTRHGDFGWFIILTHPDMPGFEFGLLDKTHETVPDTPAHPTGGAMMTFVVNDLDPVHARAAARGAEIVENPRDMPYGQRRLVLLDPDGLLVDISCPIAG